MITAEKVSKSFHNNIVINKISFTVSGGILHLCGENGCGKSTLMNMLAGSLKPDNGTIFIDNHNLYGSKAKSLKAMIGYMPAQTPVYSFLSGGDFLTFISQIKNHPFPQELVTDFKLPPHLQTPFESMSYGTRKKFLFVAAILAKPKYLLLDEPLNGLDQYSADLVSDHITTHLSSKENTCILITHDKQRLNQWQTRFHLPITSDNNLGYKIINLTTTHL